MMWSATKLTDIPPGPDLILEGNGDIWHIADVPKQWQAQHYLRQAYRSDHV